MIKKFICINKKCKKIFNPIRKNQKSCSSKCSKYYYNIKKKEEDPLYYSLNLKKNRKKNLLKVRERDKKYYYKNKLHRLALHKKWRLKNKEKISLQQKKYFLKNKYLRCTINAKRRAAKLKATPKFANLEKIKEIYKNCPKGYHVDHIIPLQGREVCGLHVEWNLQYLTPSANLTKSNKLTA